MNFDPILPNKQTTMIPVDTYPGQRLERSQEIPRLIVERKDELPSAREEIPREEVERAADKLNRLMGLLSRKQRFELKEDRERIRFRIIDPESKEKPKEIPPQKLLELLGSFSHLAGLVVDQKI